MRFKWDILSRFNSGEPSEQVVPSMEDIQNCAKRCLGNSEGTILLKHLIDEFELDAQKGCLSSDEAMYSDGKQDALKYLLALMLD